jgi:hypothetical protein
LTRKILQPASPAYSLPEGAAAAAGVAAAEAVAAAEVAAEAAAAALAVEAAVAAAACHGEPAGSASAQHFGITVTEEILVSRGTIKLCVVATLPI